MKIFILTDMEGASGVTDWSQCSPESGSYDYGRAMLNHDVAAAVSGFREGGADEIVVLDGHMGGGNLRLDLVPEGAKYILGKISPRPLPFLDSSFDALAFVGQHAMAGTQKAILPHTQSSTDWLGHWINGQEMGEIGQGATLAGHYDVPVILLTGDKAACDEAENLLPGIETVSVKDGISATRAKCLSLGETERKIREGAAKSLEKTGILKPLKPNLPLTVRVTFATSALADSREKGGATRVDRLTVERIHESAETVYTV